MSGAILDLHLHLVALDPADSDGGWFSPARRKHPVFRWMRKTSGLPLRDEGFDAEFRTGLKNIVAGADSLACESGYGGFCAVGLPMDCPYRPDGEKMLNEGDFFVPNAYAIRLATGEGRLLSGASIHPYRKDAIALLEEAHGRGAVLVKWLQTSQEIDSRDPRTREFADACRRLGMPLLIHTGSEGATRNIHPEWNKPRSLMPLLETGATIIAAHSGMRSLPHEPCHFEEWIAMLPDWPNLYGDTAALFCLRPRKLMRALDRDLVVDRLVHGSDWPVPNWPGWYWPGLAFSAIRRLARIRNPLWRDVATKLAAGIPQEVFIRGWDLIGVR